MARPPRIPYGYCPTFGQCSEYILLLDSKGIVEFRKINDLYASSRGRSQDNVQFLPSLKSKPERRGRKLLVLLWKGFVWQKENKIPNIKMTAYADTKSAPLRSLDDVLQNMRRYRFTFSGISMSSQVK